MKQKQDVMEMLKHEVPRVPRFIMRSWRYMYAMYVMYV